MLRKFVILCLLLTLLSAAAIAQDEEKPTIALLRFGPHMSYYLVDHGLLGGMLAAGLISQEEHDSLRAGMDLDGERVNVIWNDANFDFANASFIVEQAIDAGADLLVTYSTPVTQAASFITADMDDPPAVIFTSVFNPFAAGIAQATCIKPAHITGVELSTPYEDIVPLLLEQDPDIQLIGVLYSTVEASGTEGAQRITEVAASLGLEVEEAGVAQVAELGLAAEGLVESGAEALIIPADMITVSAMPIIMQVATENQIPVFHSNAFAYEQGATVSAGPTAPTMQGSLIASMVAGHLDGSLNIASTAIATISGMSVNLNLDSAAAQGVELSQALQDMAAVTIKDGAVHNEAMRRAFREIGLDDETIELIMEAANQQVGRPPEDVPLPPHVQEIVTRAMASGRRGADTAAMLAALHCTDEMIAEQQAALDAG